MNRTITYRYWFHHGATRRTVVAETLDVVVPREHVRFLLDGAVHDVAQVDPTTTLLNYLRDTLGRRGTKEGCAEGDCGACTVVSVQVADHNQLEYQAFNACIALLPALDGCELLTVESLGKPNALHPVQQALVEAHGSQCGFCTPGFVMSLFALYKHAPAIDRATVNNCLAGNLCRCTGYRPIIDAALSMHAVGAAVPETKRTRLTRSAVALDQAAADDNVAGDGEVAAQLRALRDGAIVRLRGGDAGERPGADISGGPNELYAPTALADACAYLAEFPDATIVAGGTDVGLWITKQHRDLPRILYLRKIDSLRNIESCSDAWHIGACVAVTAVYNALAGTWPSLDELWRRFASPPIRNMATLGGNIANGSPIGDSMPALIALQAELVLTSAIGARQLPLDAFYHGYRKTDLAVGEIVTSIKLPKPTAGQFFRAFKISKRADQDISALCAAFCVNVVDGRIESCRIAFGGMSAVPARAYQTEQSLVGAMLLDAGPVDAQLDMAQALQDEAKQALGQDFAPIDDLRASAAYRQLVAANLLGKFLTELTHEMGVREERQ
jgi:xanthine dehydrogenase small subunit